MGDDTVSIVHDALYDVGFANGIEFGALRPVADAVVNRLRAAGITDDFIERAFAEIETSPPA
jgi:hypothetical protein